MTDTFTEVIAFCRKRYANCRRRQPNLAAAHVLIINHVHGREPGNADAERRLFDFLSRHHVSPDLTKACKEVLEQLGGAP